MNKLTLALQQIAQHESDNRYRHYASDYEQSVIDDLLLLEYIWFPDMSFMLTEAGQAWIEKYAKVTTND